MKLKWYARASRDAQGRYQLEDQGTEKLNKNEVYKGEGDDPGR